MGVYKLQRFSDPEALKKINPEHLLELLLPHASFFQDRGLKLPKRREGESIDYDKLVDIIASPDEEVPGGLIHALYFIHEMSTPDAMDELRVEARRHGIEISEASEVSPADLATQVWLKAPELVERKHAETKLPRKRTYCHYQSAVVPATGSRARKPLAKTLRALESYLGTWFKEHDRGDGCRIRASISNGEVWYLIWHGRTLHREGTVKDGNPSSVVFRPECYDIAVYNSGIGEIRIKAESDREIQEYRRAFGQFVFKAPDFFPGVEKYTLEPLRTYGANALVCQDIDGMKKVGLKELRFTWDNGHQAIEIQQASDVFEALRARGRSIPDEARLTLAKFSVLFDGLKTPRTVTVRPPNISSYTRDEDSSPVEEWLKRRGFVL